jgi:chorismate dehydratase
MSNSKIAAVSYLNTKPFIYGIENCLNSTDFELNIYPPAKCAEVLLKEDTEFGLVPVAALPELKNYRIISDYCIGSEKKVDSVCLYSDVTLDKIETIQLDFESKTSVNLVKVLAKNYWKINPKWTKSSLNFEENISTNEAAVVIGDKTFKLKNQYKYTIDLATEWFNYTGLPFVFACWVAHKTVSKEKVELLNNALHFGINHIEYSVKEFSHIFGELIDINDYFKNCISFELTSQKKQGLELFLKLLTQNKQHVSNLISGKLT